MFRSAIPVFGLTLLLAAAAHPPLASGGPKANKPLPGPMGPSDDNQGGGDFHILPIDPAPPDDEGDEIDPGLKPPPEHREDGDTGPEPVPQPAPGMPVEVPPEHQDDYDRARRAVENGDYEAGWEHVRSIIDKDPEEAIGYKLGAWVKLKEGEHEEALELARMGLQRAPRDPHLWEMAKHISASIPGRQADGGLKKAQAPPGRDPRPARDLDARNRRAAGPSMFREGAAVSPTALGKGSARSAPQTALITSGWRHMSLGGYRSAIRAFTAQIEKDPESWLAFRLRAMAKHRLKDYKGSYEDASRAIELNPEDTWAYKTRGRALTEMRRFEEALRDFARAIDLEPRDADAYLARALLWERIGELEKKLEDLKVAASIDPSLREMYRQELTASRKTEAAPKTRAPWPRWPLYVLALLLGFALIGYALFHRPGETTIAAGAGAARASAPAESVVGFDMVRKLGQGGMGEVWEAVDRALQRPVAIKKMRQEIAGDPRERKRFLKEARMVAALRHPNIIEIFQVLEDGEELYLVFEYVKGTSLLEVLDSRKALPLPEALGVLRQVAEALDYAHGRKVVHQDLKPANIMVADGGVKVMDFGIARRVAETMSTLSRSEVCGTPHYMAPEQEQGLYSPASDVFALGACFYQMLTGLPPFNSGSVFQKLNKTYLPLSAVVPTLPEGLDGVLGKALEPDAAKRFQSASEFVKALEGVKA